MVDCASECSESSFWGETREGFLPKELLGIRQRRKKQAAGREETREGRVYCLH